MFHTLIPESHLAFNDYESWIVRRIIPGLPYWVIGRYIAGVNARVHHRLMKYWQFREDDCDSRRPIGVSRHWDMIPEKFKVFPLIKEHIGDFSHGIWLGPDNGTILDKSISNLCEHTSSFKYPLIPSNPYSWMNEEDDSFNIALDCGACGRIISESMDELCRSLQPNEVRRQHDDILAFSAMWNTFGERVIDMWNNQDDLCIQLYEEYTRVRKWNR